MKGGWRKAALDWSAKIVAHNGSRGKEQAEIQAVTSAELDTYCPSRLVSPRLTLSDPTACVMGHKEMFTGWALIWKAKVHTLGDYQTYPTVTNCEDPGGLLVF
jgi:hypothetical protein